jgi:predicted Zn-dependent protease with MMP-like domain
MHNGWRCLAGYPRTVQAAEGDSPEPAARIRRRDRHGRGLRGVLAPPGVPLYRTRTERFDDLVLQAVARLEPQWEAHLSGVEFAVEEIPPLDEAFGGARGPVPLSRLEPGTPRSRAAEPGDGWPDGPGKPGADKPDGAAGQHPPRIVVYRRPLMARADDDDELGELVFDVVVEEFARMLGLDPGDVDPGYGGD